MTILNAAKRKLGLIPEPIKKFGFKFLQSPLAPEPVRAVSRLGFNPLDPVTSIKTAFEPVDTFGKASGGAVNIQLSKKRTGETNKRLADQLFNIQAQIEDPRTSSEGRAILRKNIKLINQELNRSSKLHKGVVKKEVQSPWKTIPAAVGTGALMLGGAKAAMNPLTFAKFAGTSAALGGAFGAGAATLQGKKPSEIIEEARQSSSEFFGRSPAMFGVIQGTNPLFNKALSKVPAAVPSVIKERAIPAALNVVQGIPVDLSINRKPLTPESVGVDLVTGALFGSGQFGGTEFKLPSSKQLSEIGRVFKGQEGFINVGAKIGGSTEEIVQKAAREGFATLSDQEKNLIKNNVTIEQYREIANQKPAGFFKQQDAEKMDIIKNPPKMPDFLNTPEMQKQLNQAMEITQKRELRDLVEKEIRESVVPENRKNLQTVMKTIDKVLEEQPIKQGADIQGQTPLRFLNEPPVKPSDIRQGGEEILSNPPPIKTLGTPEASPLQRLEGGFEKGREIREVKPKLTLGVRTQLLDRLSPVFDLVKKSGKNLSAETNPYKRMRMLAGVDGTIERELEEGLGPTLKGMDAQQRADLSALTVLDRMREISSTGKKTFLSPEEIETAQKELVAKYGQEGFAKLQGDAQAVRQFGNTLLDRLRASGIISDASYNAIKSKNQFYVPFEIVEHMSDNLEKGNFTRTSYNVASQDVIKRLEGSEKELGDPIEAMIRKTAKVIALTERNNAMKSLVDLRKVDPLFQDLIKPMGETDQIPKGMDVINVFENGENVRYLVPEEVAGAVKNLNSESSNVLVRFLTPQARLLRLGTVMLNIGFIPVNVIRDFQNALFQTGAEDGFKGTMDFVFSYPAALASAAKRGKLWQDWMKQGGAQGTLTEQIFKRPDVTVDSLAGVKPPAFKRVATSIPDGIRYLGEVAEQATRLARYKAGLEMGESPMEAAFKSRDVTVDFSKAGTTGKLINQVVPFLNANIQGTERLFHAWKQNPKQAAIMAGVMAGTPAAILYSWNRNFEDYNDIPQYERDLNWIIMFKDRDPRERADREPLHALKIPKGQILAPVANATENFLRWFDKNDPQAFPEFAATVIGDMSPIGFPYNEESLGKTLSRVTPPVLRGGIETATGQSLFRGQPIVPESLQDVAPEEQYTQYTPGVYKAAGQLFNASPLKIENFVRTTAGGVGQQVAELASGNIRKGTVGQVSRRFTEVQGGEQVGRDFDEIRELETEKRTVSLKNRRTAEKILNEITAAQTKQGRQEVLRKYQNQGAITPEVEAALEDIAEDRVLKITSIEKSLRNSSTKTRAQIIFNQLNSMRTREERAAYVERMSQIKALTPQVEEEIGLLMQQQQK